MSGQVWVLPSAVRPDHRLAESHVTPSVVTSVRCEISRQGHRPTLLTGLAGLCCHRIIARLRDVGRRVNHKRVEHFCHQ